MSQGLDRRSFFGVASASALLYAAGTRQTFAATLTAFPGGPGALDELALAFTGRFAWPQSVREALWRRAARISPEWGGTLLLQNSSISTLLTSGTEADSCEFKDSTEHVWTGLACVGAVNALRKKPETFRWFSGCRFANVEAHLFRRSGGQFFLARPADVSVALPRRLTLSVVATEYP